MKDNATGVYDSEALFLPLALGIQTISGNTWVIFDNRHSATQDSIEQGALSNIGAAHNDDDREFHFHWG